MSGLAPPFAHTSGPRDASVVLVGEAWGEQEELTGYPFVGASGQELSRILLDAGLKRQDLLLTNVLAKRPPNNNIDLLCGPKKDAGFNYALAPLRQGKYLMPEHLPELDRLGEELAFAPRTLVVALGATACWALLGRGAIGSLRGVVARGVGPGEHLKVLPTYHPAAVLRNWSLRVVVLQDLLKAKREALFPEIRRPHREVLVDPTLPEIAEWYQEASRAELLAVDIETMHKTISCVGFARSANRAICIPFADDRFLARSYWPTVADEVAAWEWVRALLQLPVPKVFQNGVYDISYLWRMGLPVRNSLHDTMLLHHSMFPELQKSLGFMGSIYTSESSWKLMRQRKKEEDLKREE